MHCPQKRFAGLFVRKERWGLSWNGWVVVLGVAITFCIVLTRQAHGFLAITERVETPNLAVEGWINEHAIRTAAVEIKTGDYQHIFTTGGPIKGLGGMEAEERNYASFGANLLRKAGVPEDSIQVVQASKIGRDRTYVSAVALRDWFQSNHLAVRSLNVLTEDAHARRTRLLFQKAFGNGVTIGIIAIPDPDYDAKHWWRYSEGVRQVLGEGIAYLYARFWFRASAAPELEEQLASVRSQ